MNTEAPLLTKYEAAKMLSLTTGQVSRMASSGKLPTVKMPNGEIRFCRDDLAEWVRRNTTNAKPIFVGPDEAARMIGVPTDFLLRICGRMEIPGAYRLPFGIGDVWSFDVDKLAAWIRTLDGGHNV
jgi:excisionase family DNA binding protein